MARIEVKVTMKGIYSFEAPSFGYGYETRHIYNMEAEDGTVYVWKTTATMHIEVPYTGDPGMHCFEDRKGNPVDHAPVKKGDVLVITADVKGQKEYKGQPQTELTRVKVKEMLSEVKTASQIEAERKAAEEAKRQAQKDSLMEGDFIWRMSYKQFKEHYSDCETVAGSFQSIGGHYSTIEVIIRDGRLVNSGVRGQRFSGYEFYYKVDGVQYRTTYRAVCEENALKRLYKNNPGATDVTPGRIYQYGC